MKELKPYRPWQLLLLTAAALSLGGCENTIFNSKGLLGVQEAHLIVVAFVAMLIVVIPTISLVVIFAVRYRSSNTSANYDPNWSKSNVIEVAIWAVPIAIISFLAVLAYKTSHDLDPYRPLDSNVKPLEVQVVSLDWKWLFIYPEQGIATINELYIPEKTPINFEVTSQTVMNTFFIPKLGGMIYAMAGQRTELHLLANEEGQFDGVSGNYSGVGYNAGMYFDVHSTTQQDFQSWVAKVQSSEQALDFAKYQELANHDHKLLAADPHYKIQHTPAQSFTLSDPGLFRKVLGQFIDYNKSGQTVSQTHATEGGED